MGKKWHVVQYTNTGEMDLVDDWTVKDVPRKSLAGPLSPEQILAAIEVVEAVKAHADCYVPRGVLEAVEAYDAALADTPNEPQP
jgi:hypothetical protein